MRAQAIVTAVLAAAAASCGGGSSQCQTADCSVPGTTVIKWEFDHEPDLGFSDDGCTDVGAVMMRVEADGAGSGSSALTSCTDGQTTFVGLDPGSYNVTVTPLDATGMSLVTAPVTTVIAAADENQTTTATVEIPYTAWTTAYTGTFLFRITWGGASCEAAEPPIVTQTLTLTAGGQVVTATASNGQKLDGTDPEACYASSQEFPQSVTMLPFGPATLRVVGQGSGSGSADVLDHTFQTFVGAGKANPTLTFDVPEPSADAGVADAMDAGSGSGSGSGG